MFCFPKKELKESNENNQILTQILHNIDSVKRDNIVSEYKINEKINDFQKNIDEKINILILKNNQLIEKNNKLVEQNKILFDFIIEHFNEEKNKEENILNNLDLEIKKNKVNIPVIQEVLQKEVLQETVVQETVVQEEEVLQETVVQEEEVVQETVVQEVKKKRVYNRKKK